MARLGNVLLVYVLVLAPHTALAWGGAAWFAKKYDQRVRPWVAVAVFVLGLVISFATLSWMPEGQFNYSPWQILCSGLAMVILAVVRVLRLRDIYPNFLLVWWAVGCRFDVPRYGAHGRARCGGRTGRGASGLA